MVVAPSTQPHVSGTGSATPTLAVRDLRVSIDSREIIHGIDLTVNKGEVHAILGPNGSGKSTLAYALMGHPRYDVTAGEVELKGEDLLGMSADERSRNGLFLCFQYPTSIPGIQMGNFLRLAMKARFGDAAVKTFRKELTEKLKILKMDDSYMRRYLNEGFSGGEKKKAEILQMALLKPEIAIMDETDSGLDVDAFKVVADGVNAMRGPDIGFVVITHYNRMLEYIKPDFVHVLIGGKIVKSGGPELAVAVDQNGYQPILEEVRAQGIEVELMEEAGATYAREEPTDREHDPFRSHGLTGL
ncbi:MAG: Fe-S cluster assembly ATPase SufC [Chloroflexota bacterium]|jgi:Fe-S cluster assembly ATP-binding protein|nr:Fe-S cluster assembly ATPase SufC [Chloroflexota bacterium]NCA12660.1 Fe-S cluster assembly ATPase SufC [Pseudomonadota bacterium]